jgi:hypothetical protein
MHHILWKLKNICNVYCTLTFFLTIYNVQFHTLSRADGSATTILFTHSCSKGSTFSVPYTTLAVVNKGLNMWQKMHMGRGPEDWNKRHMCLRQELFSVGKFIVNWGDPQMCGKFWHTRSDNKFHKLATVCLPWRQPQHGLMMLAYQRFTAVLLLIFGSLLLSGVYYCLSGIRCAVARRSELEFKQRTNIKFLVKLGKSGGKIREMLVQIYRDNSTKKAVYTWVTENQLGKS